MTVSNMMLNSASKDLRSEKVMKIDLEDITPNPFNIASMDDLEDLANSIKENGLIVPVVVYKESNHNYILIGGERRYRAHKLLAVEDSQYEHINAIILNKPDAEIEERLGIIVANAQREQTKENIKGMVDELSLIYDMKQTRQDDIKDNDILKLRKRDWISQNIGFKISPRSVQEYLTGVHAAPEEQPTPSQDKKKLESVTKKIKSLFKLIDNLELENLDYTYQDLTNYQNEIRELEQLLKGEIDYINKVKIVELDNN